MSVTYLRAKNGFSLIELLVTLLIIGLLGGIVGPNIMSWLESRTIAQQKNQIANYLESLPLSARTQKERIELTGENTFNDVNFSVNKPIVVLPNGFCLGGKGIIRAQGRSANFEVSAPFCKVTMRP